MVFTTPAFLFLFLPLFLILYYISPHQFKTPIILVGSWVFYAFWRVDFLLLVILTSFANYLFGHYISRFRLNRSFSRKIFIGAVTSNLSVLAYFKYFNFGTDSLNALLNLMGLKGTPVFNIILPIGISFYIFQSMSYVIDVYREDAEPASSFIELATYIALFPQLIAGPILRYKDIVDQLKERNHSLYIFGQGFTIFMLGVSKKVLIADTVAPIADVMFSQVAPSFIEAWLGALTYGIQIYFDFSGYSDMALGLGNMLGFHFKQNFNTPYKSKSITEFWQRWHISLSGWLRDYLYIPLGGNKKGPIRTYINLFLVMLLGGLWHGAAWNFIIWGLWHGGWLMLERRFHLHKNHKSLFLKIVRWLRTMVIVGISWVFFRAETCGAIKNMISGMFGLNGFLLSHSVNWQLSRFSLAVTGLSIVLLAFERKYDDNLTLNRFRETSLSQALILFFLFFLSLLKILADSYSPFLYFRF